jgi:hypothetical protein
MAYSIGPDGYWSIESIECHPVCEKATIGFKSLRPFSSDSGVRYSMNGSGSIANFTS